MKESVTQKSKDAVPVPCIIQIAIGNNGPIIQQSAGGDNIGTTITNLQSENVRLKEEIKWLRSLVESMANANSNSRKKLAYKFACGNEYKNGNK